MPTNKGKIEGKAPSDTGIWNIVASATAKGKGKEKVMHESEFEDEGSIPRGGRLHGEESISVALGRSQGKGRRTGPARTLSLSERESRVTPLDPLDSDDVSVTQSHVMPPQDQNGTGRLRKRTITDSMTNGHSPRKRRKTEPGPTIPHSSDLGSMDGRVPPDAMPSVPASSTYTNRSGRQSRRLQDSPLRSKTPIGRISRVMPNRAARRTSQVWWCSISIGPLSSSLTFMFLKVNAYSTPVTLPGTLQDITATNANEIPIPLSVPKLNIKRIKLLVRRPPPSFSNPRQKPPPSRYNTSLPAFLSSYTTLNDQDLDDAALEQQAITDAALLERAGEFRRQGRFIPGTDVLFGTNTDTETSFTTPKRVSTDAWDDVVEAIIVQGRLRLRRVVGRQIAAQIAGKIQVYWDGHAARKDKAKIQEERRLKALAKASIKMVTNEWKKAVFVRQFKTFWPEGSAQASLF